MGKVYTSLVGQIDILVLCNILSFLEGLGHNLLDIHEIETLRKRLSTTFRYVFFIPQLEIHAISTIPLVKNASRQSVFDLDFEGGLARLDTSFTRIKSNQKTNSVSFL